MHNYLMADPSATNSNRIGDSSQNYNTITSTNPIIPKNLSKSKRIISTRYV